MGEFVVVTQEKYEELTRAKVTLEVIEKMNEIVPSYSFKETIEGLLKALKPEKPEETEPEAEEAEPAEDDNEV